MTCPECKDTKFVEAYGHITFTGKHGRREHSPVKVKVPCHLCNNPTNKTQTDLLFDSIKAWEPAP